MCIPYIYFTGFPIGDYCVNCNKKKLHLVCQHFIVLKVVIYSYCVNCNKSIRFICNTSLLHRGSELPTFDPSRISLATSINKEVYFACTFLYVIFSHWNMTLVTVTLTISITLGHSPMVIWSYSFPSEVLENSSNIFKQLNIKVY